jgi:hypothetical protein
MMMMSVMMVMIILMEAMTGERNYEIRQVLT